MKDLERQFAALGDRVWLDTAHQGVLPVVAAEAAREAIEWKLRPWGMSSQRFSGVPARLRAALARLLAVPPEEVALANSSSYGLHLLANGFPWRRGDEVLLVHGDFPSTILPWLGLGRRGVEVRFVTPCGSAVTADEVAAAATRRTRVFCTTSVHSFTGHAVDAQALGTVCRERGIRFVLNASQAIGSRPFAPGLLPLDAVTSVGFKWLCGPYGTGFCWMRRELLESLDYNQLYWLAFGTAEDLEEDAELDLSRSRDLGARRYDVFGTANFFNFTAWTAAIELLLGCGLDRVAAHDQALVDRLIAGIDPARFAVTSPHGGPERSCLVFVSHRRPDRNRRLHDALRGAGIYVALRRGRLRFSPHVHNTAAQIDRVLEALNAGG